MLRGMVEETREIMDSWLLSRVYADELSGDSVRLIVLEPGDKDDPLHCTLKTTSLAAAADKYEAISYAWGDPNNLADIECNKVTLGITANLASALGQLRYRDKPRQLWADAICINQQDIEERNQQVQKMGHVYESAKSVLVCLGEDPANVAEDCFELICETNDYLGKLLRRHGHWGNLPFLGNSTTIENDLTRWEKLRVLSTLPWFRRLWVVQETGMAKRCILHWGESKMPFSEYVELQLWLAMRPDIRSRSGPVNDVASAECFEYVQCRFRNTQTWRRSKPLAAYRANAIRNIPTAFVNVLAAGRRLKATDPRDYVYGFLGNPLAIAGDGQMMITPDYKKSWQDVYFQTACTLLRQPREAPYVLSHTHHISGDEIRTSSGFPSWVPRWGQDSSPAPLGNPQFWFSAGGPQSTLQIEVNSCKSLSVRALACDEVSWVSQPILDYNLSLDRTEWDTAFSSNRVPFIDVLYEEVGDNWPYSEKKLLNQFPSVLAVGFAPWQLSDPSEMTRTREYYEDYLDIVRRAAALESGLPNPNDHYEGLDYAFHLKHAHNRRLFRTSSGNLGLGPLATQHGDVCCLFAGVSVPFVLRPARQGGYHLVGECYIDGFMKWELLSLPRGRSEDWELLTIW
ncbi:unnamed protein product [Clonostachys rhizophaga]|uniref:Heterokaryon incompatibility domain-containing protein n=1 Tax=Clonostachys rhizophaga TaxID=160324 RepID=A0A9N9VPD0_9HYPO|nr:unnamed protein product [Clonostachys rhizophaga]